AHARQRKRAYLDQALARLGRAAPTAVDAVLLEGSIIDAIREQAARSQADLVVMTTHGRGPLGRFWLGSVADKLLRLLSVPLLLVNPGENPPDLTVEPAFKHILVPLDGSELAERMLTPATTLGGLMGSHYTLLRVIRPVHPTLPHTEGLAIAQLAGEILD